MAGMVAAGRVVFQGLRMFGLFGRRVTQRLNTVDLGDDLDDVEMLEAFECVFGVSIEDHEAEQLYTVGQLYDLVRTKVADNKDFDPFWALTVQIVREFSGSRDGIDHETTFFRKYASKRD